MDLTGKLVDLAVLMACFWGLLKWTVNRELKNIYATMALQFKAIGEVLQRVEKQGDSHSRDIRDHHARISVLEDRGGSLGRRKTDHCSAPDCPYEVPRGAQD